MLKSTPNNWKELQFYQHRADSKKLAGLLLAAKRYRPNMELKVARKREGAMVKTYGFAS